MALFISLFLGFGVHVAKGQACSGSVNDVTASPQSVCYAGIVDFAVDADPSVDLSVEWLFEDGTTQTGLSVDHAMFTSDPCGAVLEVEYVITCVDDNSLVESGIIDISVFPELNASTNQNGCTVNLNPACPSFNVTWEDSNGNSGMGISYTGDPGESGTVVFTLSNSGAPTGCQEDEATASFDCFTASCPDILDVTQNKTEVCEGEAAFFEIIADPPNGFLCTWEFENWPSANGISTVHNFLNLSGCPETQMVDYTIECIATGAILETGSLEVDVFPEPSATILGESSCALEVIPDCPEYIISYVDDQGNSGNGALFSGVAGNSGSVDFTISVDATISGACETATINGTYDCNDCPQDLEIDLIESVTITEGESVQLNALVEYGTGQLTFAWSPQADLTCFDCPDPMANPVSTMTFSLQVSDELGCSATAEVLVNVESLPVLPAVPEPIMQAPSAFTPNGDQANDAFKIISDIPTSHLLVIYNRWGEEVFSTNEFGGSWDGTNNGELSEAGVYVFFARSTFGTGEEEIIRKLSGNITLLR